MKSPIKWVGGKSKLVEKLIPLIPEHKCYVEVFGGAGWMLFSKNKSKVEVLNDFDSNLMNFWSVIKTAPEEFVKSFDYTLVSRELFNTYREKYKNNDFEDNIEKAHVFYYLVEAGFASDMKNPIFGATGHRNRSDLKIERIKENIDNAYNRLIEVTVENKSFEDILRMYDNEKTFFYIDPPYRNTKQYAVGKFTDEQYKLLAEKCKTLKGKFMITINNDEYIYDLFKDFNIINNEVHYSVCKQSEGMKYFKELIITNYEI